MSRKFFKKERPDLFMLSDRLIEYGMQYSGFKEKLEFFGKNLTTILETIRVNEDCALHRTTKSGNVERYFPFYDFWLDHYCGIFEDAIWHSVYTSELVKGNKKAESVADQAAKKFVETMQ